MSDARNDPTVVVEAWRGTVSTLACRLRMTPGELETALRRIARPERNRLVIDVQMHDWQTVKRRLRPQGADE